MSLQPGQVLNNRYRIVRLLGQGGFGAVYRAWDLNLNKPCAVKENLAFVPEAQRQFQREASILANLTHPNLPRVIDHFAIANQGQYLVMDFVEGEDLASLMQRGDRLDLNQALEWINQVGGALTYLHTQVPPVVHRDVKPANIRITPEGRAMLVDFGLFKFDVPSKSTTAGARAITPGYAPPEQYGRGHTDARTDLYALAATFYAILTKQEPMESVLRIAGNPLPPVHQINRSISPEIGNAIEKAMELEPENRYKSVDEFLAALHEADATVIMQPVHQPETMVAMRPMTVQASAPSDVSVRQPPADQLGAYPTTGVPPRESQPEVRKRSWGKVLAVILLLLIVGTAFTLGGIYLLSGTVGTTDETDENFEATIQAGAQSTVESRKQATGTAKALSVAQNGWTLVYGPVEGGILHDPGDGLIGSVKAPVGLKDLIVEATFTNPYAPNVGSWDYGFVFRHSGPDRQYRFIVRSDRTWLLRNNDGGVDGDIIAAGNLAMLRTGQGETNQLKLVVDGDQGQFLLNDQLISELDLSGRINSGDVYLVTAVIKADEVAGYETQFHDFSVWSKP